MKRNKLENKLEALITSLKVTEDRNTQIDIICQYNYLNLQYAEKYGKEYIPKEIRR